MSSKDRARSTLTSSLVVHGEKERGPISVTCRFGVEGYTLDGQGYRPIVADNAAVIP